MMRCMPYLSQRATTRSYLSSKGWFSGSDVCEQLLSQRHVLGSLIWLSMSGHLGLDGVRSLLFNIAATPGLVGDVCLHRYV